MVGRNEPCPCGSGKKYKKCCEGAQQPTIKKVFLEEIEHVLQTFYNSYPERKDIKDYFELVQQWKPSLEQNLQRELIEAVALDDFFFHQRRDIWTGYLKKVSKKIIRPALKELMQQWESPKMFIGQVEALENQYFKASCTITKSELYIRRESNKPIPEGMQVFAFLLPDGSGENNHYLAVSTLIFLPNQYKQAFDAFAMEYDDKVEVDQFLQNNHFNFWVKLVETGYNGEEYSSFEIDVIEQTKQFLLDKNIEADRLVEILEDYLVEKKPKARKASAIAAGAIRFAQERNLLQNHSFTIKEIAESFGVSSSSLNKYYQELLEYDNVLV
ncbi:SEC-C metal-binding domain-containing protein [Lysinibacillus telephonicus]|uniref:SEC-C metal-binding domain-containing protein n=1 Tax=Lysinibacillus telephonicus TaxID=1714840 RepID=UPI0031FC9D29